ncbi:MAG: DUF4259 domain-containing protein [Planctomycetales bacterium]|nr:DUF4259 domain-containing protein [Planctomycetales bacterium]
MGTWGAGNFENDTAADHLSALTGRFISDIEEALREPAKIEADEYWGSCLPCNIELLTMLAKAGYAGVMIPQPDEVSRWRNTFMEVWESTVDHLNPRQGYKAKRRLALEKTFDELELIAKQRD